MLKKALHLLANLSLGKDLALALKILNLLAPLAGRLSGLDVARLVYVQLPANWKFPNGPATEDEFLDAIQAGQLFLGKVKALTTH
ncbi:hypothetical protein [Vampirovibrio chlorellavorus]|uniref:hypothetical protein n=1 Tax=Vampirovibrio chlorellavorus TaxID=758823 RepID=UPI0026EB4628|nr:hypothetical protein [Vampirovibrio chlorellavorus]